MELTIKKVVTAFLRHNGRVLLVQRSHKVGSYQGKWSAISGYLEDPTPLDQAEREIEEETGLSLHDLHFVCNAEPIEVRAPELKTCWLVHPFLFDIDNPDKIQLDWENVQSMWVRPHELSRYETVPALTEALQACLAVEHKSLLE